MGTIDDEFYSESLISIFNDLHSLIRSAGSHKDSGVISLVIRDKKVGSIDIIHNIKSNNETLIEILEMTIETLKSQK